jgi:hypothetical protein
MESDYYAPQTISSKKLLLFYRFFADFVIQMLQLRYFLFISTLKGKEKQHLKPLLEITKGKSYKITRLKKRGIFSYQTKPTS